MKKSKSVTSKSAKGSKLRSKSGHNKSRKPKKFMADVGFLAKSGLVAAALIAVAAGLGFSYSDETTKPSVAGLAEEKGAIYMEVPDKVAVGQEFTAKLWADSNVKYNAAQAGIVFTEHLDYMDVDHTNSSFGIDAPITAKEEMVVIPKGNIEPLMDNNLIGEVKFKATNTGQAVISLDENTKLLTSDGNNNIVSSLPLYQIEIVN